MSLSSILWRGFSPCRMQRLPFTLSSFGHQPVRLSKLAILYWHSLHTASLPRKNPRTSLRASCTRRIPRHSKLVGCCVENVAQLRYIWKSWKWKLEMETGNVRAHCDIDLAGGPLSKKRLCLSTVECSSYIASFPGLRIASLVPRHTDK